MTDGEQFSSDILSDGSRKIISRPVIRYVKDKSDEFLTFLDINAC